MTPLRVGFIGAGFSANIHAGILAADGRRWGCISIRRQRLPTERALDAGVHVLCKKPLATSPEDAARVLEAANRSSGVYQAGFNRRFAPVYVALKQARRRRSAHGGLRAAKDEPGRAAASAWTGDPAISGGFLYETPIHILDLARHMFGEPADIVCRAARLWRLAAIAKQLRRRPPNDDPGHKYPVPPPKSEDHPIGLCRNRIGQPQNC